jgi:uncharacterized protein YcfL
VVCPLILMILLLVVCSGKKDIVLKVNLSQVLRNTSDKFLSVQFDSGMIARHWQHINCRCVGIILFLVLRI